MGTGEKWAELLASDSTDDQATALRQISGSPSVTGFTTSVVRLAGSRDDEVRMWSAEALETAIQPTVEEADELGRLLSHAGDGEICYWAATMLGRLGPDAVDAVEALETCVGQSMYLPAREQATWALRQIGPRASVALDTLKQAAEGAPPRLHRMAIEAIRVISSAA